jgi:hypothetical protein
MIHAIFTDTDTITVFGLCQYDTEQTLKIEGVKLTEGMEVHFANCKSQTAISKKLIDGTTVIPNELLGQPHSIDAWLWGENETLKTIILPIKKRKKPDNYTSVSNSEALFEIERMIDESGVIAYDEAYRQS